MSLCQFQFLGRFSKILRRCEGFVTPAAHKSSSVMPLVETNGVEKNLIRKLDVSHTIYLLIYARL